MKRRSFLSSMPFVATPMMLQAEPQPYQSDSMYYIGPKAGYTPHIGVLVGKLHYNRQMLIYAVNGMSTGQLDYLQDEEANSIGALLLHLAATEKYYQVETMEGRAMTDEENARWSAAGDLGDRGRAEIKGNNLDYYLDALAEVRETSLKGFKERDDEWLMGVVDEDNQLNTYWAWFHVCEHEASHRGQITWLKKRLS